MKGWLFDLSQFLLLYSLFSYAPMRLELKAMPAIMSLYFQSIFQAFSWPQPLLFAQPLHRSRFTLKTEKKFLQGRKVLSLHRDFGFATNIGCMGLQDRFEVNTRSLLKVYCFIRFTTELEMINGRYESKKQQHY